MNNTVNKKKSISEQVYEQIKKMILHFEIKPGERIPEEKITEIVKSSRTPVREALRKLNEEGLVTIYPGRYSEVAYYDKDIVKKIGELRLSQDLLSCQLAIRNGSNSDFAILKEYADKCEYNAKNGNVYEQIFYDNKFHLQIAKIGRNELLFENQEKLYLKIHLIQISKYADIEHINMHKDIINALYERDYKEIVKLMCIHLVKFYDIEKDVVDMYLSDLESIREHI